jgi:hypothetical protein
MYRDVIIAPGYFVNALPDDEEAVARTGFNENTTEIRFLVDG